MVSQLQDLIVFNKQIVAEHSDSITIKIILDAENQKKIQNFHEDNFIEEIKNINGEIVSIENLNNFNTQTLFIEFVTAELKKINFYIEVNDFIASNRFEIPDNFYISKIDYVNNAEKSSDEIEKYKVITKLICKLISRAKFVAEENIRTLYLIQENSFLELPIGDTMYENSFESEDLNLINEFTENIEAYKEKRSIFIKELMDFLSEVSTDKFMYLLSNFKDFYNRCNSSFEYYLANFSFNKVKLELDNSVLEHSKNIRAIINESQSKLVAIPAAFVLAISQIDFKDAFCIKNIGIAVSSFLFSYIISIFIKNQINALEIVSDNVRNYKNIYKKSKDNIFESEKELTTLTQLINTSYDKTEKELINQNKRLNILQSFNWGISIMLILSLILTKMYSSFWFMFSLACLLA